MSQHSFLRGLRTRFILRFLAVLSTLIVFAVMLGIAASLNLPGEAYAAPAVRDHANASSGVTFVVTNTNDSGVGSLRQTILNANNNPGADTITFHIVAFLPPPQEFTISPLSALPAITDPVTIDGTTQLGGHQPCHIVLGHPCIVLNGSHGTLHITAGNSTVKGVVIHGAVTGISLETKGSNHIAGNYIGTTVTGTAIISNQVGISIFNSPDNVIGGTSAAERNLISGNVIGIKINDMGSTASGNHIMGNYIGLNASGTGPLGNSAIGVEFVDAGGNTIGGQAPGDGNVISGNGTGIALADSGGSGGNTFDNVIQGNYIGTDHTGMLAVSNLSYGIGLSGDVHNTMIRDNLISGNAGSGVLIVGSNFLPSGNSIQNNHIGTKANGVEALPNSSAGVAIQSGARDNTVQGNVIAFSGGNGVTVGKTVSDTAQRNSIQNNSIYSNTLLGIDLGGNGVTPNDASDADAGPNTLQNYPALSSAVSLGGSLSVAGILTSTSNTALTVEFFANRGCDASGHGEGESYIGLLPVTTGSNGSASFNTILFGSIPAGQFVTATATDPNGNTSEFSECVAVIPPLEVYLPLIMR